ncbi:MAG: BamA/TamA family outer membrane protein [Ignavibacteriaceae bacterium]|nr:BamA/TamA family outer membrane protein [Ignavibacteriaceae bacterium]
MTKTFFLFAIFISFSFTSAQEANKVELTSIDFIGNSTYSSSLLRDVISSKETPSWFWKFLNSISSSIGKEAVYFDSLSLHEDITALNNFYNVNGFFKANFSYTFKIDTVQRNASVTFQIKERQASTFSEIKLIGLEALPKELTEAIFKDFNISKKEQFSQFLLKSNIDAIIYNLNTSGYMLAAFDSSIIEKDTIDNRANVNVYFKLRLRYKISEVQIEKKGEGSDFVETDLLKDLVGIKQDEFYNSEKIRQSQVRLYRTGLFNYVQVIPITEDTSGHFVPLKVVGSIGKMNELAPELIMNNQQSTFNLGLGATFIRKNFLGHARKLTLTSAFGVQDLWQINFGKVIKAFTLRDTSLAGYFDSKLKIEQPYVFNKPIFGILEGYFTLRKDAVSNKRNYGGKLSFEFELPAKSFINFLSSYYNIEIADEIFFLTDRELTRSQTLSILGLDLRSIKTLNPLFPANGYNLSVALEEANSIPYFISRITNKAYTTPLYYKTQITFAKYLATNKKETSVLGLKLKTGYLRAYRGNELDVPTTKKFFAGGSNSIRGWRARELSPKVEVPVLNEATNTMESVLLEGGSFLLEASTEYRYKLTESIGVTTFVDFGNTWSNVKKTRISEIAIASGFGFRYYTMIAPFRIDFGFKSYDPYSDKRLFKRKFFDLMEFHFGIGEAF